MRTAHLFAGGGGGILADLILGHDPVLAIEINPACCRMLEERKTEGWFDDLHIHCGDARKFDWTTWQGRVDCLVSGFPCQDISAAGTGCGGLAGKRSGLVAEVFRAIDSARPNLVFLENSPLIRTRGRHIVIAELVALGYSWRDGKLAASDVGAPHKRDRWWCLAANADGIRQLEQERREFKEWGWVGDGCKSWRAKRQRQQGEVQPDGRFISSAPDRLRHRLQSAVQCGGLSEASAATIEAAARYTGAYHWSPPDAGIRGMVDVLAYSLDGMSKKERIKACGNGQVPLAAAAAWLILSGALLLTTKPFPRESRLSDCGTNPSGR